MDQAFLKLIEMIEKASPAVWEIVNKQVYVDATESFLWALILGGIAITLFKFIPFFKKKEIEDSYEMWDIALIFSWVIAPISLLVSLVFLMDALKMLYNPQFYAIQYLINNIK